MSNRRGPFVLPSLCWLAAVGCAVGGQGHSAAAPCIRLEAFLPWEDVLGPDPDAPYSLDLLADGAVLLNVANVELVRFRVDDRGAAVGVRSLFKDLYLYPELGPLSVSPDGRRLAAGGVGHGAVHLMRIGADGVPSPERVLEFGSPIHGAWLVAWRTNTELIVWNLYGQLGCFDLRSDRWLWERRECHGYVAVSPDHSHVLTPYVEPGVAAVIRATDGAEVGRCGHEAIAEVMTFGAVSDDGRRAVIGRYGRDTFVVWNADRRTAIPLALDGQSDGESVDESAGMCFLPGSHFALVHWPRTIWVLDTDDGRLASRCDLPIRGNDSGFGPAWVMRIDPAGRRCYLLASEGILMLGIRLEP